MSELHNNVAFHVTRVMDKRFKGNSEQNTQDTVGQVEIHMYNAGHLNKEDFVNCKIHQIPWIEAFCIVL